MTNVVNSRFFSSDAGMHFAKNTVKKLNVELSDLTIKKFSCGEFYVKYNESVRGRDVFLFHTIRPGSINEDFMQLFLLCDAAKQSFAKEIHVILPHFGYSRQDKIHDAREGISAKLMADLLVKSGMDHMVTLHFHSDQTQGFFDVPVDNVNTQNMFVNYFKNIQKEKNISDFIVVSPDAGGAKYAKSFADKLGVELAIMHKSRPKHNHAEINEVVGNISAKTCILVDDMIDTAGTICAAKYALLSNGANSDIYLCATHPIFSGPAIERLNNADFKEILVSDSIPLKGDVKNINILSSSELLADIIKNTLDQKSVSELF